MKVHTFDSTTEAYNTSQWNDEIKDGDILHVPREKVTGLLVAAWPTAVTEEHGSFHRLADGVTWESFEGGRYVESALAAAKVAES